MDKAIKLDSLDTSYVKLGALLRHLQQSGFVGRVRVMLHQYEADVFLYGSEEPSVWESDSSTGQSAQGKEAMERLLVRAQEPGGVITIHQTGGATDSGADVGKPESPTSEFIDQTGTGSEAASVEEVNWDALLAASGELIAAVERAVRDIGEDFSTRFSSALVEIADDYSFLEPTKGVLKYSAGTVQLRERPAASIYVSSLTEALRRVVNKVASGKDGASFRERVAIELRVSAREKENGLAEFTRQLERIAGTQVL
ncbi:MAG: hypothetical protein ABR556_04845 [Pyrinomonadaceae bacterium]